MKKKTGTTIWHVRTKWEGGAWYDGGHIVVIVSRNAEGSLMRIRSLTARAAGRLFLRNNLANIIATEEHESYVHGERATKKQEKDNVVQRIVCNAELRILA